MTNRSTPTVQQYSADSIEIELPMSSAKDWEAHFLLRSDAHHDHALADHSLERQHLDEMVDRDGYCLDAGDLFDAMQGRDDKRREAEALRPEHAHENYLDRLVDTAAAFYEPYASRMLLMSPGNHETKVKKVAGVCLTSRLVGELRNRGASSLHLGSYTGFVRFKARRGRAAYSLVLAWHHGFGGGGGTTKGQGQFQRLQAVYPDASILWMGHTHDQTTSTVSRSRIRPNGETYFDRVSCVRTPGYKREWQPRAGWAVERGGEPKPLGAAWLRLWVDRSDELMKFEVREAF